MPFQKVKVFITCSDAFEALEGVLGSLLPMTKNASSQIAFSITQQQPEYQQIIN
jgi:hypothetical protein